MADVTAPSRTSAAPRAAARRAASAVRRFGYAPSRSSHLLAWLLVLVGLVWLLAPLLWSRLAPDAVQRGREAPLVLLLEVLLLGLLGVATWRDAGRDAWTLGVALGLAGANGLVRAFLNVGGGLELNYVIPLLVGMAGGAPLGVLVGALSCLGSQLALDLVAGPLPGQIPVWALFGLVGGLLRGLRPVVAWLAGAVVAVVLGPVSGMLLNLTGWTTDVGTATTSFCPGLPADVLLTRLWNFSQETSFALDATRGVTTAVVVLLVGLPLLRVLRPLWTPALTPAVAPPAPGTPAPEAVARRERLSRLDALWRKEAR